MSTLTSNLTKTTADKPQKLTRLTVLGEDAEFLIQYIEEEAARSNTLISRQPYSTVVHRVPHEGESDAQRALAIIKKDPELTRRPLRQPKDLQEGTANHVQMIINACADGEAKEAGYLADDLLDQLVCNALVVTERVPPLDYALVQKAKKESYEEGFAAGKKAAAEVALSQVRQKVREALAGVL